MAGLPVAGLAAAGLAAAGPGRGLQTLCRGWCKSGRVDGHLIRPNLTDKEWQRRLPMRPAEVHIMAFAGAAVKAGSMNHLLLAFRLERAGALSARRTRPAVSAILGRCRKWKLSEEPYQRRHQEHLAGIVSSRRGARPRISPPGPGRRCSASPSSRRSRTAGEWPAPASSRSTARRPAACQEAGTTSSSGRSIQPGPSPSTSCPARSGCRPCRCGSSAFTSGRWFCRRWSRVCSPSWCCTGRSGGWPGLRQA